MQRSTDRCIKNATTSSSLHFFCNDQHMPLQIMQRPTSRCIFDCNDRLVVAYHATSNGSLHKLCNDLLLVAFFCNELLPVAFFLQRAVGRCILLATSDWSLQKQCNDQQVVAQSQKPRCPAPGTQIPRPRSPAPDTQTQIPRPRFPDQSDTQIS